MFQNMLMTGLTPLQDTDELKCWQNRPFIGTWPGGLVDRTIKKRHRTCYTAMQVNELEAAYSTGKYLDPARKTNLAISLNIPERNVKLWFQNRRMKEKKLRSELMFEYTTATRFAATPPAYYANQIKTELCYLPNNYVYDQQPNQVPDSSNSQYLYSNIGAGHVEYQYPILPAYTSNQESLNNVVNCSYSPHNNSYSSSSQFSDTESELSYFSMN